LSLQTLALLIQTGFVSLSYISGLHNSARDKDCISVPEGKYRWFLNTISITDLNICPFCV